MSLVAKEPEFESVVMVPVTLKVAKLSLRL